MIQAGTRLNNQRNILQGIKIEIYFLSSIQYLPIHRRAHEPRQPATLTGRILDQKCDREANTQHITPTKTTEMPLRGLKACEQ